MSALTPRRGFLLALVGVATSTFDARQVFQRENTHWFGRLRSRVIGYSSEYSRFGTSMTRQCGRVLEASAAAELMSLWICSPLLSLRAALAFASRLLLYLSTFRLLPFHPSPRSFEPSEQPQRLPSRHGPQAAVGHSHGCRSHPSS